MTLTLNSAKTLPRTLRSAATLADEFVVVDGYSTDDTVTIARNFGAKVVQRKPDGFGPARNEALKIVEGDWVFNLDSDETITSDLEEELERYMDGGSCNAIKVPRVNVKAGRVSQWLSKDYELRLYKKGLLRYTKLIHETDSPDFLEAPVYVYAQHPLTNYNSMNFREQYWKNVRDFRWSILSSKMSSASRLFRLPYFMVKWPLYLLVRQHYLRDGLHGIALALVEVVAYVNALEIVIRDGAYRSKAKAPWGRKGPRRRRRESTD